MNTSHRSEARVNLALTGWIMFQNFTVTKHNDLSFDNDTKF
jgi:hypothetical protein